MSAQADARGDLTEVLQTIELNGAPLVVRFNPTNLNPWCVSFLDQDPVLINTNTAGSADQWEYNLTLWCVGNSSDSLPALEDLVEDVLLALGQSDLDCYIGDVSAPVNGDGGDGKVFLSISVPVRIRLQITGGQ